MSMSARRFLWHRISNFEKLNRWNFDAPPPGRSLRRPLMPIVDESARGRGAWRKEQWDGMELDVERESEEVGRAGAARLLKACDEKNTQGHTGSYV